MDTNKSVLIYMSESSLKPIGGPAGYLFNLRMGLSKLNVQNVEFMKTETHKSKLKVVFNRLPLTFRVFYQASQTVFSFSQAIWTISTCICC